MPRIDGVEAAVLAAGTASMGLEILAGRMLAPAYGSSVYTWGSVIGVFLAALSLGYYVGGRRAARHASGTEMRYILMGAAVYSLVLLVADPVLTAFVALPVPARYAVLFPAVLLFGPPVFFLGLLSPYAAELSPAGTTGRASGRVFAVGTVGSIAGAFGATFVLIPLLPEAWIVALFAGILLAGAAGVGRRTVLPVLLIGVVVVAAAGLSTAQLGGETLHQTETPYQTLRVAQDGAVRTMYLNGQPQSAMDVSDPDRHVFGYTPAFHIPAVLQDDVDRALFIGGGGFTGPKDFVRRYNATVDAVELDPAVVDAAEQYFNVSESDRLNIHVMDGRRFLRETDHTYDVIVLDAYRRDRVPFHLTTVEFFRLARQHLTADGALHMNVISATDGPSSRFYHAVTRTLQQVFPTVYSFPTADTPFLQNIQVVATTGDRLTEDALRTRFDTAPVDLSPFLARYRVPAPGNATVLRDDHAPVDSLLAPQIGRRVVTAHDD